MQNFSDSSKNQNLSIWWRRGIIIILLLEFAVLIWVTTGSYYRRLKPPIPEKVTDSVGLVIFTRTDIENGQQLFLKKALMDNGSIWGHGAYMGPDFSAQYLHNLALEVTGFIAAEKYKIPISDISSAQKESIVALTRDFMTKNRYSYVSHNLLFTQPEIKSYNQQILTGEIIFKNRSQTGVYQIL